MTDLSIAALHIQMLKPAPSSHALPRDHLRLRSRRDGSRLHIDSTAHGWSAITAVVISAGAIVVGLLLK